MKKEEEKKLTVNDLLNGILQQEEQNYRRYDDVNIVIGLNYSTWHCIVDEVYNNKDKFGSYFNPAEPFKFRGCRVLKSSDIPENVVEFFNAIRK